MKKLLSMLMSAVLLISMCYTTIFAASCHVVDTASTNTVTMNGFHFCIEEYTDSNLRTVRKYENTRSPAAYSVSASSSEEAIIAETESLLLALGLEQPVIDNLTEKTMQIYANCLEITVATSYIKEDEDGNISYVSKEEALSNAAQEVQPLSISDSETESDTYMMITHTAAHQGNGHYLFSTTGTWLTMPVIRGIDSIGSCAPELSIYNDTRFGWYSYYYKENDYIFDVTTSDTVLAYSTDYSNAINGDWYGSAVKFRLPSNISNQNYNITYSNFRAYYEFEADIRHPELATNFNSVGTYSHQTLAITLDPSLSISFGGDVDASIGLSLGLGVDDRSAQLTLHYTPNS